MRRQSPLNMFTPDDSIQRPGCSPRSDVLVSGHGQPRRFGRRRTYSFILHVSIVTAITGCWLPMLNSGIRSPRSDVSRVQHRNRPRSNSTLRPSRLPQVVPRAVARPRAGPPSSRVSTMYCRSSARGHRAKRGRASSSSIRPAGSTPPIRSLFRTTLRAVPSSSISRCPTETCPTDHAPSVPDSGPGPHGNSCPSTHPIVSSLHGRTASVHLSLRSALGGEDLASLKLGAGLGKGL